MTGPEGNLSLILLVYFHPDFRHIMKTKRMLKDDGPEWAIAWLIYDLCHQTSKYCRKCWGRIKSKLY